MAPFDYLSCIELRPIYVRYHYSLRVGCVLFLNILESGSKGFKLHLDWNRYYSTIANYLDHMGDVDPS